MNRFTKNSRFAMSDRKNVFRSGQSDREEHGQGALSTVDEHSRRGGDVKGLDCCGDGGISAASASRSEPANHGFRYF
ncbi:hypothetical protein [Paraburkholderia aromaticivorans]|uniref:hypothetical protein n=1 Tax=Paraburkholderia aromaticivorans TaxID=2026199 RepID=UPI001455DFE5|nr:hypothetical protein [Paraburkholderia aromaticivorans]